MPLILGIALFVVIVKGIIDLLSPKTPKTKGTDVKDQFEFPTNSGNRLKPKLYGTRWITGPHIADYGKYSAKPIWSDEVYDD